MLPGPATAPVASPTVGQNEKAGCLRIDMPSGVQPPLLDCPYGKCRSVSRCANPDVALVRPHIVDPIRSGYTLGHAGECIIAYLDRLLTPRPPGSLEVAHQLFLLGVYADNWVA